MLRESGDVRGGKRLLSLHLVRASVTHVAEATRRFVTRKAWIGTGLDKRPLHLQSQPFPGSTTGERGLPLLLELREREKIDSLPLS